MVTVNKPILQTETGEKIVWIGTPSQFINILLYIVCALTSIFILPVIYAIYTWYDTAFTNFELTSERIVMRKGIFWRRLDDLELYRVKDIALLEPLLLRFFKLSNIELITSDPTYPDIMIQGVEKGIELREKIRKLVMQARQKRVSGKLIITTRNKKKPWLRPTFPSAEADSIIGADSFHFLVRDGKGWYRAAPVTRAKFIIPLRRES